MLQEPIVFIYYEHKWSFLIIYIMPVKVNIIHSCVFYFYHNYVILKEINAVGNS